MAEPGGRRPRSGKGDGAVNVLLPEDADDRMGIWPTIVSWIAVVIVVVGILAVAS